VKKKKTSKKKTLKVAPPFIQIAVGSDSEHGHDVFGLDANGRVWEYTEDEIVGGWELLDNDIWSPRKSR
jgi:hypothetical protein